MKYEIRIIKKHLTLICWAIIQWKSQHHWMDDQLNRPDQEKKRFVITTKIKNQIIDKWLSEFNSIFGFLSEDTSFKDQLSDQERKILPKEDQAEQRPKYFTWK